MHNVWWIFLLIFIGTNILYSQLYKVITKKSKDDGAITVFLQFFSGIMALLFIPLFKIQFPMQIMSYVLLVIACIFYAITDRVNTTARRGLEVSIYDMLSQICSILIVIWGILFFKEPLLLKKVIGTCLILMGNVVILYKKEGIENKKYVLFSLLGNITFSIAVTIDVGVANQFNLPIYVAFTLILPSLFLMIMERVSIKNLINEYKYGEKKAIVAICITWAGMLISMLRAYQLAPVTTVAPLCAVTTILNVIASYVFLKERTSLIKKIIAAIIVVLGVILINI